MSLLQSSSVRLTSSELRTFAAVLVVFVGTGVVFRGEQPLFLIAILAIVLAWIATIDFHRYVVPNALSYALALGGVLYNALTGQIGLIDSLLGGVLAFMTLFAVSFLFRRLRKKEGLGWGDVKLVSAVGFWLGWPPLPDLMLIASLMGLTIYALLHVVGRLPRSGRIPFAPAICLSFWIIMLFGPIFAVV